MGFGALRSLVLETNLWAHGLPIRLQTSALDPWIDTTGIWLTNTTPEALDGAARGGREVLREWREVRHVMAIPRSAADRVPTQSRLIAPEAEGGPDVAWLVDTVAGKFADRTHVVLRRDPGGLP